MTTTLTAERMLWGLCVRAHAQATLSGFHDVPRDPAISIALIHSELSELLESLRDDGAGMSAKCPDISACEEEAADVLIRLADLCADMGWDLGRAVESKMAHNATRPRKHGRAF